MNINQVIAGLEWIVNGVLDAAFLVSAGLHPASGGPARFTLFNSAYYLKSIPIRIDAPEVMAAEGYSPSQRSRLLAARGACRAHEPAVHPAQGLSS